MAKILRVAPDPDEVSATPQTVEEAQDAYDAVHQEFTDLIVERRAKREELGKWAWRAYNDETSDLQIDLQTKLEEARRDLSRQLGTNRATQHVEIGAAVETSEAGGVG